MKGVKVVITKHCVRRFEERFQCVAYYQIRKVVQDASREGLSSIESGNVLIQHGCCLIAGVIEGEKLIVKTVYNLSKRISNRLQRRLARMTRYRWNVVEIVF